MKNRYEFPNDKLGVNYSIQLKGKIDTYIFYVEIDNLFISAESIKKYFDKLPRERFLHEMIYWFPQYEHMPHLYTYNLLSKTLNKSINDFLFYEESKDRFIYAVSNHKLTHNELEYLENIIIQLHDAGYDLEDVFDIWKNLYDSTGKGKSIQYFLYKDKQN